MTSNKIEKVSIKFRAGAYAAYRSMNNKVWYALAEYVDNALQSYLACKNELINIDGQDYQFTIYMDILINENIIKIYDNAGGINHDNFIRAFEPANIPLDSTGLSEFGMGMKIASIWLADYYYVRSSAYGEEVEREVSFDLLKVIGEEKETLEVYSSEADINSHFTEIVLRGLSHNAPKNLGAQINKIKSHLTSIYRGFLRTGELNLVFNGEKLTYDEPEILVAPYYSDPEGKNIVWKKEISFEFGSYNVYGFIGLLKEMKKNHSGLSLFRRGRVIQGSHDEKYHPTIICGQPGSPRDKRIFGELHLEGFKVSFDKGRFTQVGELDELLSMVKLELNRPELNLLKQGDFYRKPVGKPEKTKIIREALNSERFNSFSTELRDKTNNVVKKLQSLSESVEEREVGSKNALEQIEITYNFRNNEYHLDIEFVQQRDLDLCELFETTTPFTWKGRINLSHPFFEVTEVMNQDTIQVVIKMLKYLLLSEAISVAQGTRMGGYIRRNLSLLLKQL